MAHTCHATDDMNPSQSYLLAAREAVIAVARKEGLEPDTMLYDRFLASQAEEQER